MLISRNFLEVLLLIFFSVAVYEKDLTIQQVLEQPIRNDFVSENCRAFVLGEE